MAYKTKTKNVHGVHFNATLEIKGMQTNQTKQNKNRSEPKRWKSINLG